VICQVHASSAGRRVHAELTLSGGRSGRAWRRSALFHLEVTDIHSSGTPVMGYSYCTLVHGTIMISGGSGIPGTTSHGDDQHACALARDAVAHLQRLT
jgi:hypothetical protein